MREHLSRELFRAISSGWRDPGDLARIAVGHLFELCSHCRREYEAWRREVPDEEAVPVHADYESVIESIRARVQPASEGAEAPIDSDIRHARSRAEDLLRLPPEQQAEWIRTESERHAGPLLAEVLIEESRRKTPGYPRKGYTLADLARLVLYHAPASPATPSSTPGLWAVWPTPCGSSATSPGRTRCCGMPAISSGPRAAATARSAPSSMASKARS